ncbi:hypothetical protein Ahy_A05g023466 [Arachis hypogaea]|uniref:Uncharacterized protein n=1 Tax=Arachis hypogaea TaxID=3818 RepID=A0A445D3Q8_ARAHY|nr:hypothetical protein Ahy_A05g023466 [Arachis hypogaea]
METIFFLSSGKAVKKIVAWIHIPNLPIELYNHQFLSRVGSTIGTILKIDRSTSIHSRGKFARLCVKIDRTKQLVPRISVLRSILNIEYEGLHLICFYYEKYGRKSEQCSELPKVEMNHHEKVGAKESEGVGEDKGSKINANHEANNGCSNSFQKEKIKIPLILGLG